MKISLEQYMYKNFIKYDKLATIINEAFKGSNAQSVNLFIDIYSMIKGIYSNKSIAIDDYSALTASIINLCAHFRHFFETKYGVSSKIYIVYSRNHCELNRNLWLEYNHNMFNTMSSMSNIDDMILNNMSLLETLCPYIPDVFFISGEYETGVYMLDIMCKNEVAGNTNPNIILTKDAYNYQLIPMRDHNIVLRPTKRNGEDKSYHLDKSNLIERFVIIDRTTIPTPKINELNSGLFTLLLSLSRVPERGMKSVFNVTAAINILYEAVKNFKLYNGYNTNLEMVWDAIYTDSFNIGYSVFEARFKAIDLIYQHGIFINDVKSKDINFLNLYDTEALKTINNKYFKNNPLDLNRL